MENSRISRRGLLAGGLGLGGAALLSACAGSGSSAASATTSAAGAASAAGTTSAAAASAAGTTTAASTGRALTLQSSLSDPMPKAALAAVMKSFKGPKTTLNTVALEQFRAQLSTYLSSSNPPDALTWYAGSVAQDYAGQNLLLDVSDLWTGTGACAKYSPALKGLSSTSDGSKQIFVPTNYYWWSVFYKKSAFEKWGVEAPTTWDGFMTLCDTLKGKGIHPLAQGLGTSPWMASGWFDYLNLRLNGATYHRELLAGKHSFTDKPVVDVLTEYKKLIPYFDPNYPSYSYQEAATPVVQDKTAMYLVGAFVTQFFPKAQQDDIDFFSVPVINASIPTAEEAPTDGYFASAKTGNAGGTKELLSYLASGPAQQQFIELSGSSNLPTSPDVDTTKFTPLVKKGLELLNTTKDITQFFNRDSSDALQTTADTALTKFMADPSNIPGILSDWQKAAQKVLHP